MATVSEHIDIEVPVDTAYNQWTQFESFPQFMGGVESVTQLDDTTNHWVTKIGGVEREFDTRITEQEPDRVIAWQSVDGKSHSGRVTFTPLGTGGAAGAYDGGPGAAGGAPDLSAGLDPQVEERMASVPGSVSAEGTGTRVSVELTWDDATFVEKVGQAVGLDSMQVKKDLQRFKEFIESRGAETGGWRGSV